MSDDGHEDWEDEESDEFCDIAHHYVWCGDLSFHPLLDDPKELAGICQWCRDEAGVLVDWALEAGMTYHGVLGRIESLYTEDGEEELGQLLGSTLLKRFRAAV